MVRLVELQLIYELPLILERWIQRVSTISDDCCPVAEGTLKECLALCCTWALGRVGSIAVRCSLISILCLFADYISCTGHCYLSQETMCITLGCMLCCIACNLVCPWQVLDSLVEVVHQGIQYFITICLCHICIRQV